MRSIEPMPGNPWPHDMTITVEERPTALRELLWVRESYALRPVGDNLPPLLLETPAPASGRIGDATRTEWEQRWAGLWQAASIHAGQERDASLFARLQETADASEARAAILTEMFGPTWGDEFGREAFDDDSYIEWEHRDQDSFLSSRRDALENSPERRDLEALIPAWRAGLATIVTISVRDPYAVRLGRHGLLLDAGTRTDSSAYRAALGAFAAQS